MDRRADRERVLWPTGHRIMVMRHKLKAVIGPLTIVAIKSAQGFTEHTFPAVRAIVEAARPDFMEYLPPMGFFVCFKPKSASRANSLIANVQELRRRPGQFSDIGAGSAAGKVVYERDWLRRIRSQPLGAVVNQAFRAAEAEASAA